MLFFVILTLSYMLKLNSLCEQVADTYKFKNQETFWLIF